MPSPESASASAPTEAELPESTHVPSAHPSSPIADVEDPSSPTAGPGGCPFTVMMKALAEQEEKDGQSFPNPTGNGPQTAHPEPSQNSFHISNDLHKMLPTPNDNDVDGCDARPEIQFSHRRSSLTAFIAEGAPLTQDLLVQGLDDLPRPGFAEPVHRSGPIPVRSPLACRRGAGASKCPFSGAQSPVAAEVKKGSAPTFDSGSAASERDHTSSAGSFAGSKRPSKLAPSRTSHAQSRMTGTTARTRRRRVVARVNFSNFEAQTHAPVIRANWAAALELRSIEEIGLVFYDELFRDMPEIQHMFTSGRGAQAAKFAAMLHAVVASVDSEANLYVQLRALAPLHVDRGVSMTHMPKMGQVLIAVLEKVLGDAFDAAAHAAWRWMWNWLSKVMQQTLEEVRFGQNAVIRSWNIAQDNCPDHLVGLAFVETMFQLVPAIRAVFFKPKQILACKFVEMLSTLVSFSGDPERMAEQITWLGIRHVAYGAELEHVGSLGQVLVKTMERCVGDEWTEEMHTEWLRLWEDVCAALFGVMKEARQHGSTLSDLWHTVEGQTNEGCFGGTLKRKLLSGTEWVAGLNRRMKETDAAKKRAPAPAPSSTSTTPHKHGAGKGEEARSVGRGGGSGLLSPRSMASKAPSESAVSPLEAVAKTRREEPAPPSAPSSPLPPPPPAAQNTGPNIRSCSSNPPPSSSSSPPASSSAARTSSLLRNCFPSSFAQEGGETLVEGLPQAKVGDCDAIGHHFWDLLRTCIGLLWQPEQQHEQIIVRAHDMYEWGIRSAQLQAIGEALAKTMEEYVTEAGTPWSEQEMAAWAWFWGIVEHSLRRVLDVCERGDARVVTESWELAQRLVPPDELGEAIFQNLARIAPYIVPLFRRPRQIQSAQFISAVDMLVQFGTEPAAFFHGFQELVIRHIKYGVKTEYAKPFGQAVLLGVKNALGDHWTQEVAEAWNNLWLRVSSCITRALNVGTNILVVALVQGDAEQLAQAARCAPRQERHHWMTRVDVNGQVLSPLAWAVRDGKFNLVEFMLGDLLAIRADRDAYYYGRQELFEAHPDIVSLLCHECPFLMYVLLDGLLWHSQFVSLDGTVRVNYYLENIYGDPRTYPDAWTSPLAVLVKHKDPDNFLHPVVVKTVNLKWTRFGRYVFLLMQAWYVVLLALLMVGNVLHVGDCAYQPLRITLAAAAALTAVVQTAFMCRQVAQGQTTHVSVWHTGTHHVQATLPVWLGSSWNMQRYLSCVLLPFAALLEPCHSAPPHSIGLFHPSSLRDSDSVTVAGRACSALTAMLLWTQALQLFVVSTRLAALSWSLGMMFQDVSRNLIVVAVFILAWASGLTALQETNFEHFDLGIVNLCRKVLSLSPPDSDDMHPLSAIFLFTFAIANIGMVAILIAQIKASYDVVAKHKHGIALQHRAHICIDVESILPRQYRQKLFDQFGFDQSVPFDQGDLGPSGGIQVKEASSIRKHAKYIPDRVMRYTGDSCPTDPWEMEEEEEEEALQEEEG